MGLTVLPARLLRVVAFVHLPFSFRSLDLLVALLSFMRYLKSADGPHDSCSSKEKDCLASVYSLALTWMSFRDFPLRYDIRGGSLNIFLSCGWFCIKCYFSMSISFKLGKAGWYCVTKGRIFFRAVLFLSVKDVSLSENLTSEGSFSTVAAG